MKHQRLLWLSAALVVLAVGIAILAAMLQRSSQPTGSPGAHSTSSTPSIPCDMTCRELWKELQGETTLRAAELWSSYVGRSVSWNGFVADAMKASDDRTIVGFVMPDVLVHVTLAPDQASSAADLKPGAPASYEGRLVSYHPTDCFTLDQGRIVWARNDLTIRDAFRPAPSE